MNTIATVKYTRDSLPRPLAPIIKLKTVLKEEIPRKKRISAPKTDKITPASFDKPIYKPKKYDLF